MPDAPSTPTKFAATTTSITVQWNEPLYNGGNAITDYNVYVDDGANSGIYTLYGSTGSPSVRQLLVSGLTRGLGYRFKITATNLVGESVQSTEGFVYAATVPLQPETPYLTLQSSNAITIEWIEPDNGGSNIDDYQVKMCLGSSPTCSFATIAVTTNGLTQLALTGLSRGSYYQFKVLAHNGIGYGSESGVLLAVAADVPNKPDAPVNDVSVTSGTQIGITYTAPV